MALVYNRLTSSAPNLGRNRYPLKHGSGVQTHLSPWSPPCRCL